MVRRAQVRNVEALLFLIVPQHGVLFADAIVAKVVLGGACARAAFKMNSNYSDKEREQGHQGKEQAEGAAEPAAEPAAEDVPGMMILLSRKRERPILEGSRTSSGKL